jgi:hypothetical protein
MDNDFLVDFLVKQLNQEMKNISKKLLTNTIKSDTINVSKEREETLNHEKEILFSARH